MDYNSGDERMGLNDEIVEWFEHPFNGLCNVPQLTTTTHICSSAE